MDYQQEGRHIIRQEMQSLELTIEAVNEAFGQAVERILECRGRVLVSGMGKSGLIGSKVSATLASTGTPSHFIHPAEAVHGDLGRIHSDDLVILLSNSGETAEVVRLLPTIKKFGAEMIAITGRRNSTMARHANLVLHIGNISEACPLNLAPSSTTTAMLVLGDALALTVLKARGFSKEQYALNHPAGTLGRSMLKAEEAMRPTSQLWTAHPDEILIELIQKGVRKNSRLSAVCIIDDEQHLLGIFTDGDLRRLLCKDFQLLQSHVGEVAAKNPKRVVEGALLAEVFFLMRSLEVDEIPVVDADNRLVGMVDIQDLLKVDVGPTEFSDKA